MSIKTQQQSPKVTEENQHIRVEDFLNDKLQTSTDLANIDALLQSVQAQQVLLQKQVSFMLQAIQWQNR